LQVRGSFLGVAMITDARPVGPDDSVHESRIPGRQRADPQARRRAQAADPDRSGLVEALDTLMEPTSRGPMCRLRWTTKSTCNLADELRGQGHAVSHHSVARLLAAELDYSLQGNAKTLDGA
jgi:Rhodopirellula transposase DDE domain